jgi:NAD(P)-dependent dehydrogenase (short-subunit alcohol dehydrogenase family)
MTGGRRWQAAAPNREESMTQGSMSGKHALVTGGTTGIGHAIAEALIGAGARVMISGQDPKRVKAAEQRLGSNAIGVVADNRSVAQIGQLADRVRGQFGRLDTLIANAGVTWTARIEDVTEADFDAQMAINLTGNYFAIQKCLPLMPRGASIVMTSSGNDSMGFDQMSVYSASKAAIRSLVRSLAVELSPRGIRVNSVAPGPIDTPIYEKIGLSPEATEQLRRDEANLTVLKRMGKPQEVGQAALFLAGDAASYITGANLRVDGGWADI